jgi:hypothetical protein
MLYKVSRTCIHCQYPKSSRLWRASSIKTYFVAAAVIANSIEKSFIESRNKLRLVVDQKRPTTAQGQEPWKRCLIKHQTFIQ